MGVGHMSFRVAGTTLRFHLWHGTAAVLLTLLAALPWLYPGAAARAYHYHDTDNGGYPFLHIATLHYAYPLQGSLDENMCVYSQVAGVSHATLKSWVNVLIYGNSVVWDLIGYTGSNGHMLDIFNNFNDCESYYPNYESSYGRFRVFVWLKPNPIYNAPCDGGTNISCVNFGYARYDGNGGVLDYYDGYIYLNYGSFGTDTIDRNQTINHEFGHIVGLMDPIYPNNWCGGSVMHQYTYYNCPDIPIEFPSSNDRSSVEQNVMPFPHLID